VTAEKALHGRKRGAEKPVDLFLMSGRLWGDKATLGEMALKKRRGKIEGSSKPL